MFAVVHVIYVLIDTLVLIRISMSVNNLRMKNHVFQVRGP